jgi:16S rRNA pseudouridine516 synthase
MSAIRLDRLLSGLGYCTRKEVDGLARAGQIVLDGTPVARGDTRIVIQSDLPTRMTVRGRPLDPLPGLCVMLSKPTGMTCSHKEAGPLVYDVLPERWRRRDPPVSTVGRLDKDTSGLLLMTDDGTLLHRIIAPKSSVTKHYRVHLARALDGHEAEVLRAGTLMLDGETKPLLPVTMHTVSPIEVVVVLQEGRYHQVRRMFAALGNHVAALHREQVGGLHLPADLAPGQWRILTADEIAMVFADHADKSC